MRRPDAVPYQATQLTGRGADRVLDDLSTLDVTGATVSERGTTYLVMAPAARRHYRPTLAAALAIAFVIGVLVAAAASVVWMVLLPLAVVPFLPLLVFDRPQLAVGAVPVDGDRSTRVTVHGRIWGDLGAALDAYLANLPAPPPGPPDPSPRAVPAAASEGRRAEEPPQP